MKNLILFAAIVTLLSQGIAQANYKVPCKACLSQDQIRALRSAHDAVKKKRVSDEAIKSLRLKKLKALQPANPPSW